MNNVIGKSDYLIRLSVVIFAALSPFICLLLVGYKSSLSQYWNTSMQPLFVFANAATSYYLITINNWKTSSVMLILLTAFSVEYYNTIHNIFAIVFFIVTIIPLWKANHFKFCMWLYLSSLLFLPFSMLYAEIIAIVSMCIFHLLTLRKAYKLQQERIEITQNQHQA